MSVDLSVPWQVIEGDCLAVMPTLPEACVDAVVTDPPYGLAFMGKAWDHGVPGVAFWAEALRVAKPGAHLLAFGGTRTFHRLTCAIEDAGWEIRDCLSWLYGSGFPKSHDVSKAMDKGGVGCGWFIDYCIEVAAERGITKKQLSSLFPSKNGNATGWLYNKASHNQDLTPAQFNALRDFLNLPFPDISSAKREVVGRRRSGLTAGTIANFNGEREFDVTAPATDMARKWHGWGTALKPAWEPVVMARKPLIGTVAANVSAHGTGALNIDGCRIATGDDLNGGAYSGGVRPTSAMGCAGEAGGTSSILEAGGGRLPPEAFKQPAGRWPANVVLDEDAARALDEQSGVQESGVAVRHRGIAPSCFSDGGTLPDIGYGDSGGASRFFYTAKASRREREAGLREAGLREAGRSDGRGKPIDNAYLRMSPVRNTHPTVKPVSLMRWLLRLVTPAGGLVLDPFAGSGTTGVASAEEGFRSLLIEREPEYVKISMGRVAHAHGPAKLPLGDPT